MSSITKIANFECYSEHHDITVQEFLDELKTDALTISEELTIGVSLLDFLSSISSILTSMYNVNIRHIQGRRHNEYDILADQGDHAFLYVYFTWDSDGDVNIKEKSVFKITVSGVPDAALKFIDDIRKAYPDRTSKIRWYFKTGERIDCHDIVLHEPSMVYPEFYPCITELGYADPMEFMQEYLNSNSSLLFLSGLPGTGKTTLLRNFLYKFKLRAVVTYEDSLFSTDAMFVDFVTSSNHDIMIIEDADNMLTPREEDNNKLISRFLNASDGIIQLRKKKIIFTTNLSDFHAVDDALIRPGRAFGAIMFRALTPQEANAAAHRIGYKNWITPDTDVSLAEIFNPPNTNGFGKRVIGFSR